MHFMLVEVARATEENSTMPDVVLRVMVADVFASCSWDMSSRLRRSDSASAKDRT